MPLPAWLRLVAAWTPVFPQRRTFHRALRQGLGSRICLGRRTLYRIIWTNGAPHRRRSAEYFLHSRARWDPQAWFAPILKEVLSY